MEREKSFLFHIENGKWEEIVLPGKGITRVLKEGKAVIDKVYSQVSLTDNNCFGGQK